MTEAIRPAHSGDIALVSGTLRIRHDKPLHEADTLDALQALIEA